MATFRLPCLRIPGAQTQTTRLHLIAQEGLALEPLEIKGLQALRPAGAGRDDQRLASRESWYGGRFRVRVRHARGFIRQRGRHITGAAVVRGWT